MEEKRKHPRYWHPFEIEYSPRANGLIYGHTRSKNISKGGVCIPVLSRLVRRGDPISLAIYSNGETTGPILVRGKVIWIRETQDLANSLNMDTEAGIEFVSADVDAIERLINSIPQDS